MTNNRDGSGMVKSDQTLFSIIELLKERDGAGVTDLAAELGLAKSTVHKHLRTMEEYGYVVNRGDAYHVGLEFFHYGEYARKQRDVYRAARLKIRELAEETGEMSWLLTHENGRVIYLDGVGGETEINVDSVIGTWAHAHCNSGGKAMLAHLSQEEIDRVVDRHGLPARTSNTITDRRVLFDELETVRERGYALNFGEDFEGIHAVGVPVTFEETVQGALAIMGPAHRMSRERCEGELADILLAAANDVELNLAYQ